MPKVPQLVAANQGLPHPKVSAHTDYILLSHKIKRSHWEVLLYPEVKAIVCENGKFAVMSILFTSVQSFQHFIFLTTLQLKHIQQQLIPSSFACLLTSSLALHFTSGIWRTR